MTPALEAAYIRILSVIPSEILDAIFEPFRLGISIEQCIYNKVVSSRVIKDLSITSGVPTVIALTEPMLERVVPESAVSFPYQTLFAVYRIPEEAREYRNLVQVVGLSFPYFQMGQFPFGANTQGGCAPVTTLQDLTDQSLAGASGMINGTAKPIPELLEPDVVKLTPTAGAPMAGFSWFLHCYLEYNKEFTNMNQSSIIPFSFLCLYAVQSYIYTYADLKIDKFYSFGGIEVGRMRQIIDSYADAEEKYNEEMKKIRYTASALNPTAKKKLIYGML